jgi:hypothetical protein
MALKRRSQLKSTKFTERKQRDLKRSELGEIRRRPRRVRSALLAERKATRKDQT